MRLLNKLMTWLRREEGQTLVEYALIVGLVSIAAILIMVTMGNAIEGVFTGIAGALNAVVFA